MNEVSYWNYISQSEGIATVLASCDIQSLNWPDINGRLAVFGLENIESNFYSMLCYHTRLIWSRDFITFIVRNT